MVEGRDDLLDEVAEWVVILAPLQCTRNTLFQTKKRHVDGCCFSKNSLLLPGLQEAKVPFRNLVLPPILKNNNNNNNSNNRIKVQ